MFTTIFLIFTLKLSIKEILDGKYLRSNPNFTKTDNLAHHIDFDWIIL